MRLMQQKQYLLQQVHKSFTDRRQEKKRQTIPNVKELSKREY